MKKRELEKKGLMITIIFKNKNFSFQLDKKLLFFLKKNTQLLILSNCLIEVKTNTDIFTFYFYLLGIFKIINWNGWMKRQILFIKSNSNSLLVQVKLYQSKNEILKFFKISIS